MAEIIDILKVCIQNGASDILLVPGEPPIARISGLLRKISGIEPADAKECRRWIYSLLNEKQRVVFEGLRELDCAISLPEIGRFRVNVFMQSSGAAAALRAVSTNIPSPQKLDLSPAIVNLIQIPHGLVLVTGPTGSGKTTTLACLLELINQSQAKHIITIEDPIEYAFQNKLAVIDQREVGVHTESFAIALKYSLRQNPDVIFIGEMRDAETMNMAMAAAETGHLCLSTLHTQDAPSTIDRIIDEFPHDSQGKVRAQLGSVLRAVVSQVLLPSKSGEGRVCAREVMLMNTGIASLIREGKIHQLYGAIEGGGAQGMISLDQSLADLIRTDKITVAEAIKKCHDAENLSRLVRMQGAGAATLADPLASAKITGVSNSR